MSAADPKVVTPFSITDRPAGFFLPYFYSVVIIAGISTGGFLIRTLVSPTNLVMPYLLGVVTVALLWGRGPAVFASVLGVIAFDIFLVPPYLTLEVEDTEYIITFLTLFVVGVIISNLTAQVKDQVRAAKDREARVALLYQLSQELAIAYSLSGVSTAIVDTIKRTLGRDVRIYLVPQEDRHLERPEFAAFPPIGEDGRVENEAVNYTFRTGIPSGYGTEAFSDSAEHYFPLVTTTGTLGVIVICGPNQGQHDPVEHRQSFEAFANLSALAIERVYLNKEASQAQLLKAKDDLQTTLLNSVSHDFRTPLVTITGTLSSLDSGMGQLDAQTQQNLVRNALLEAEKLNRLVGNLLSMSRLESGALQLQLEPVDLQDLIGASLEYLKDRAGNEIRIRIPEQIPLVKADFVLVQQALVNLLENAFKFSPDAAPIEIGVHEEAGWVYITVADRGPGIDEEELPNIFNKFYRLKNGRKSAGTGLGLAIVKGVMDAHGGKIKVLPRDGGGMVFYLGFPRLVLAETGSNEY